MSNTQINNPSDLSADTDDLSHMDLFADELDDRVNAMQASGSVSSATCISSASSAGTSSASCACSASTLCSA